MASPDTVWMFAPGVRHHPQLIRPCRSDIPLPVVCSMSNHPLTERGKDFLSGEQYVQCPCGEDREYEEGTGGKE